MTDEAIEALKTEHAPAILRTLDEWREALKARGYTVTDTDDWTDDCFSWCFGVYPNGEKDHDALEEGDLIDVRVTIAESGPYAGDRLENGENEGINILVDVVSYGGRIVGGFSPYNYSPRVWTADPLEFSERIKALQEIDGDQIGASIAEFLERL